MAPLRPSLPALNAFTRPDNPLGGRYVLEREIGSGGTAFVLVAKDLRHDRPVAVKVLRQELSYSVDSERFLREIHIAAGLTHPHILPVHDSGSTDGFLYYVMPYVTGETLAERLAREGALTVDETLRLTQQIGGALEYAHQQGIVHRDVKPENVLLPGGVAVVADFGLALALDRNSGAMRITASGVGFGTPKFISPEQALGAADVDARSDQYSLAVMVFEMLAGRTPFEGATIRQMFAQHIAKPAPPITTIRADVPKGIEKALARALMKSPDDRFPSVQAFVEALEAGASSAASGRAGVRVARRWLVLAAAVVVAATVGLMLARRAAGSLGRGLDPNLIAIAPFDAFGESLTLWREGMMDVLSRGLNDAGPLHTVSPTVVVRSWKGRADRTTAEELGRATHAGLTVFGQFIGVGSDSVRATVTLFDVRGDSALSEDLEVRDVVSRMDRVADSIAVRVLRVLSRSRSIAATPNASLGARSLAVLKAFLRGEQLYRRGEFAAAKTAYQEAIAGDSTFALAYGRMRNVLRWEPPASLPLILDYAHKAGALNHGLGRRDSLLILADSLLPDPQPAEFIDLDVLRRVRRRLAVLEQAATLYPSDPEVWSELGEARARSTGVADALSAFERAITIDPLFGPSYRAAIGLALASRGRDSTLALARQYLRINRGDRSVSLLADVLATDMSPGELHRVYQAISPGDAADVAFRLAKWPDADETAIRFFRMTLTAPNPRLTQFGAALRFRGHIREASGVQDFSYLYSVAAGAPELLFYSRYSPADAVALDSLAPRWLSDLDRNVLAVAIVRAGDRRDSLWLRRVVNTAEQASVAHRTAVDSLAWQYVAGAARAYLALATLDSASAERAFLVLPDSLAASALTAPLVIDAARLLSKRGRPRDAQALLYRHAPSRFGLSAWDVPWYVESARAEAMVGETALARAHYAFAARAWAHADPPFVRELGDCAADLRRYGIK